MKEVRKPGFLRAIPILITVFSLSFPAYAQYSGGTGEPNDPYQIATAKDLMLLGDSTEDYDKHFIMIDDIDLDPNLPGRKVFDKAVIAPDVNSVEDGFQGTSFNGVFDGNGHIISHLTIEGKSYLGLFGLIDYGATVKNMSLNVIDVNGTGFNVGGLVGQNNGKIEDCYISGIVSGQNAIGGLVGSNSDMTTLVMHSEYTGGGILTNCYSTGVIRGKKDVGGLVGYNYYGTITDCHSTASMMGTHDVGGL
ncbi:MAG: GLUG motif-containing protein, partial [Planctomycetota bacterium]